MKKWLLVGGLLAGSVAGVVLVRRRSSDSGYEWDDIDSAGEGDTFGERPANAPEQKMASAEMRHDVTPEELSMAARLETAFDAIHTAFPLLGLEELRKAEGDVDRLAGLIAEKSEQPREQVRQRLDQIVAQEVPDSSYPAH